MHLTTQVATLLRLTERYCVVAQTLRNPVDLGLRHERASAQP